MKTITLQTKDFGTIDKFNIKAGAKSLKDAVGESLTVTKACVGRDVDSDGVEVDAAAIITDKGAYTTISATAVELITDLIEIIDEMGDAEVLVESRKSNGGRDYLVLTLVG